MFKATKKMLLSSWSHECDSLSEFEEVQNSLVSHTRLREGPIDDYNVVGILKIDRQKKLVLITVSDPLKPSHQLNIGTITFDNIKSLLGEKDETAAVAFFSEAVEKKIALQDKQTKQFIFCNETLWNTWSQRIHMSKDIINVKSIVTAPFLAACMRGKGNTCIIERHVDNVSFFCAAPSVKYHYLAQNAIQSIYHSYIDNPRYKEVRFAEGKISAHRTTVSFDLIGVAEEICESYKLPFNAIPGIQIETDDTCSEGIFVYGYYRIVRKDKKGNVHNVKVFMKDPVHKDHRGQFDIEDVIQEVNEKIFDKIYELPKALKNCMNTKITPPGHNKEKRECIKVNKIYIIDAYKTCLNHVIGGEPISKTIGASRRKDFNAKIAATIDATQEYTALDIVLDVMSIPEDKDLMDGIHEDCKKKFCTQLARAPYTKWENVVYEIQYDKDKRLPIEGDSESAPGKSVELQFSPATGWAVNKIFVRKENGQEVDVKFSSSGKKASFIMPDCSVTVAAEVKKIEKTA